MVSLPADIGYGTVTWSAVGAGADSALDPDSLPDAISVVGTVTFTPSAPVLLHAGAPLTLFAKPITATLGSDGILRDAQGRPNVTLIADSPSLNPSGWTWHVDYRLVGVERVAFDFHLAPGETVDLTRAVPVGASNGVMITRGEKGETGPVGPIGPAGPPYVTSDSGEDYRVIVFSDGRVKAIPAAALAPGTPTGLSALATVSSVTLSWMSAARATGYRVFRDGVLLTTVTGTTYRDYAVEADKTYAYAVQAIDGYEQHSGLSGAATAYTDPALNAAPAILGITLWPKTPVTGGITRVRVNAIDPDAQSLALALSVDAGSLQPTADPSLWLLTL